MFPSTSKITFGVGNTSKIHHPSVTNLVETLLSQSLNLAPNPIVLLTASDLFSSLNERWFPRGASASAVIDADGLEAR